MQTSGTRPRFLTTPWAPRLVDLALPAVVGTVAVGTLVLVRSPDFDTGIDGAMSFDPWLQGQQHFTYEHGFIRRGLVGEALRQLRFLNETRLMFLLFTAVYFATAALLARLVWDAASPVGDRTRMVITGTVLALPFALPEAAHALGRYDGMLYLAVLPFLVWRLPTPAYAAIGLAGPLIHEAFLLVHLPLLFIGLVDKTDPGVEPSLARLRTDRRLHVLLAGCAIGAALIIVAGDAESMTEPEFVAIIAKDVPEYPAISGAGTLPPHSVLYTEPTDAIATVFNQYSIRAGLNILAATVPLVLLLFAFVRLHGTRARAALVRVGVASLPTCGLFLIGVDLTRWVSLASLNALLVILLELRARPFTTDALHRAQAPLVALACTVVLGPVGAMQAFPLWPALAQKL